MKAEAAVVTLVPAPGTATPGAIGGFDVCGLFRVGGALIAVPLNVMREVIPRQDLIRLPVAAPHLLGAVDVRGLVAPVFDLAAHLGIRESAAQPDQNGSDEPQSSAGGLIQGAIVLVSDGRRVLGMLVDELHGVIRVGREELMPLSVEGLDLLVSSTFRHPDSGAVFSVLDVAKLLDAPGVLSTALVGGRGARVEEQAARAEDRATLTVLRCADLVLALDVADVHTTLPPAAPRPSILSSELCLGVIAFGDSDIAVVDPLTLLGLGRLAEDRRGPVVVVKTGTAHVALVVGELVTIAQTPRSAVRPAPAAALARADLVTGAVRIEPHGDVVVVDGAALRADRELAALGSMSVPTTLGANPVGESDRRGRTRRPAEAGPAQLVYVADRMLTTPLDQVSEILSVPQRLIDTHGPDHLLGICSHRDAIVPIVDLRAALGRDQATSHGRGCVLLTPCAEGAVGWLVDSLSGIDPLTWQDDRASNHQPELTDLSGALRDSPLVRVGDNERLLPNLDLRRLSSLLLRSRAGSPWQDREAS